jgi:hypothetical protein
MTSASSKTYRMPCRRSVEAVLLMIKASWAWSYSLHVGATGPPTALRRLTKEKLH